MKVALLSLFLFLNTSLLFAQKSLFPLPAATDTSYGYTAENPIKIKQRKREKSIAQTYSFFTGLQTADGQKLQMLERGSVENPRFKNRKKILTNRFSGLPLGGNLGILDRYSFITTNTKDTIVLFVDLYEKGTLQVPIGLKHESAE